MVKKCDLIETKAVEIFEFEKNNQRYWIRADKLKKIKIIMLPIVQALYLGYFLFFLFDNTISHLINK